MDAYVYILSNKSHRLYIGATTDVVRRVREHRDGKYATAFTARYNFDRFVYYEVLPDFAAALECERAMKQWRRARKVALIQRDNPNWLDLTPRLNDLSFLR
ncbi:MAG: GIY-YIG nuclease family protein [Acidobacteriota bacterium]|nr:GIY-YIG nuclease family protein [Acidobacteriota bacterium]